MKRIPNWLKFVSRENIEAHIEQGWRPMVPNAVMHHHEYGIEMGWFGENEPPPVPNRVPETIHNGITDGNSGAQLQGSIEIDR